jgi:Na+-transporting NADH:ubiquinone oxidoreductase subunit C
MYSNFYVFRFAAIMVVVVATILSGAAMLLKPMQDRNIRIEKTQSILSAANIDNTKENAVELYKEHLEREIAVNTSGEIVSVYENGELKQGEERPFELSTKEEYNQAANPEAGKATLPIFILDKDGTKLHVIPLRGKGLWGPVYGNIALKEDLNTIAGAVFDHDKETPGLGAEINETWFEEQFIGKKIFDENNNFVSVTVVKGGVENNANIDNIHGVDAISGGTITSDGVTKMLEDNLSYYIPYIKKHI